MSWASGNKRWTLPFVSLNGTECRVDIYKKNYTGSEVITLTGCAVPIEWSEDDDEDLLNVVRAKTGTLNVIEENYGDLQELYPSLSTDHYIEVYYGETIEYDEDDGSIISREDKLIFVGFMQAQTFENEWKSGPRELSFNIMSPLGLADGLMFNKPTTPSFKSLGTLLREVVDGMNANIGYIVFPDPDSGGSMKTYCMFHMLLCSNVVTPEDGPYKYQLTTSDLFSQRSYREFIEGLCNCFGMMVHDHINKDGYVQLVFSRYDYTGKYSNISKYQLADGRYRNHITVDGNTENNLSNNTSISADDNVESLILPLNKIDITYNGGFFNSASLPFGHCSRYAGGGSGLLGWSMAYNIPINGELSSDKLISSPTLNSNGRLSSPGVVFAGVGQDSPQEMVLIQKGTGWETGVPVIFKWTLCDRPWQSFRISFNGKYGNSITNLDNPGTAPTIHLFIKCGSRYYTNSGWSTSQDAYTTSFGEHTISVSDIGTNGRGYPLEIYITTDLQYLNADYIYTIQDFKIENGLGEFFNYVYGDNGSDKHIIDGAASEVSGSVECLFSDQALTANLLSALGGNSSVGYPENPYYSAYRYLIVSQNRLQVRVKGTVPDYAYILKTIYFNTGWRWRIIAIGFNPIDDEYTITMHRSSTIE